MMGQLNSIFYGDGFALGLNASSGFFGPDAEAIADNLQNKGLAYEVSSAQIAGVINPYISVVGRSAGSWSTASAFRDALLSAIAEMGFDIDYSSPINYQIMPRSTSPQPSPAPTPRPAPRPSTPTPDEGGGEWYGVTGEPPREPYTPPSPPKKEGINTTWLLLGFGLLAIVLASRD